MHRAVLLLIFPGWVFIADVFMSLWSSRWYPYLLYAYVPAPLASPRIRLLSVAISLPLIHTSARWSPCTKSALVVQYIAFAKCFRTVSPFPNLKFLLVHIPVIIIHGLCIFPTPPIVFVPASHTSSRAIRICYYIICTILSLTPHSPRSLPAVYS
ncbi:hypothetical protein BD310DRAFT_921470 [Dichomitus squalens]|uniref:Uncharacterized protein n=1 Tax=Dichomitus squalens TaxID=114155 RepID=A0A4Q9Q1Y3_9APHY|nr:hypothetical protein BD310DRAFT_921470 [Dichomitus squalens]